MVSLRFSLIFMVCRASRRMKKQDNLSQTWLFHITRDAKTIEKIRKPKQNHRFSGVLYVKFVKFVKFGITFHKFHKFHKWNLLKLMVLLWFSLILIIFRTSRSMKKARKPKRNLTFSYHKGYQNLWKSKNT